MGYSENLTTITFAEGKQVTLMEGQTGHEYVYQLMFFTTKQDGSEGKYGPFGNVGKHTFSISGNILGFYGTAGLRIDKIGVYYI